MTARTTAVVGSAAAVVAGAVVLLSGSGSGSEPPARSVSSAKPAVAPVSSRRLPRGTTVRCSRRSEANFPGAFGDRRNLVVGPLVLVDGAYTPESVVREFGGNKFPLLVKAGHSVTVRLSPEVRRVAGLAYGGLGNGRLPQGQRLKLRDTADTMTFIACRPGKPSATYRPEGPSGSYADGEQVTFWSGFVLTSVPSCLWLDVSVDDDPSPRHVGLALGRRCSA